MKWYMLDNYDHSVNEAEFANGTKTEEVVEYFAKIKQLEVSKFKRIWRVLNENEIAAFRRKPSSERHPAGEFGDWLDMEKA